MTIDRTQNATVQGQLAGYSDIERMMTMAMLQSCGGVQGIQGLLHGAFAGDVYNLRAQGGPQVSTTGVKTIGDQPPGTAGPHEAYGHSGKSAADQAQEQGLCYVP